MREKEKTELEKAALSVQKAWLEGMEKEIGEIDEEQPAGMKERLAQAYREVQPQAGKRSDRSGRRSRRPALRWAFAAFAMLIILAGSWLAFDKTARAEAVYWMKGALGIELTSQEAYDRLIRHLGGTPDQRGLYRDPEGEALRPYFAGARLNEEKELVVEVTDDSPEILQAFRDVLRSDHVIFNKVRYSYDRLYAVYQKMCEKYQTEPFQGLSAFSIDIGSNRIEVDFWEDGFEIRDRFLAWLGMDNESMFRFTNEAVWVIRDQEDQDLMELTHLLEKDLLTASRLTELGDVEAARMPAQELPPEMLADIEYYMQYKAETTYKITKLEKDTVEDGDLVWITYRAYTKTQFLDPKEIEIPCRCGGELSPPLEAIEASVTAGRRVGESYTIEYTDAPYATDETVYCDITICYIYLAEPCELNDEFVRKYTEYSSVEEWREAQIKEHMKWMVPDAWDQVLKKLLPQCRFELDEERISAEADKPEKAMAQIREYLLVRAIADHYGITATDSDVQAYIDRCQIFLPGLPAAARTACEWRALRELVMEKMTEP